MHMNFLQHNVSLLTHHNTPKTTAHIRTPRDAERRLQEANAANEHWKTVQAEAQAARDKEHAAWKRAVEYGEDASQQADVCWGESVFRGECVERVPWVFLLTPQCVIVLRTTRTQTFNTFSPTNLPHTASSGGSCCQGCRNYTACHCCCRRNRTAGRQHCTTGQCNSCRVKVEN